MKFEEGKVRRGRVGQSIKSPWQVVQGSVRPGQGGGRKSEAWSGRLGQVI